MLPLASEPELEPEPEEIEPEESVAVEHAPAQVSAPAAWVNYAEEDWHPSEEAGAAAAMTPAAPSAVRLPARSSHSWVAAPVPAAPAFPPAARSAAPATPETSSRPSVAPVVATLPPIGMAPRLAPVRAAMSADSKLLAVGGALAAAMLLVAVGVLLGQRSSGPTSSAGGTATYPLVVDTRAPASGALPAATRPIEAHPAMAARPVERVDAPATIDVQNLPAAPKPRPQGWTVATTPAAPTATGWTVAPPAARPAATTMVPSTTDTPESAADDTPPVASAAAVTPEAPAPSAHPPVDSFVQAVRDDIHEDEARGTGK
jgi:hypothetical protein